MVRNIIRDPFFLSQKSEPATKEDTQVVEDLLDTLRANSVRCVGMAANMIGVKKCIIAVAMGPFCFAMQNPVILQKKDPYEAKEGCLSLDGVRSCTRYKEIEVEYYDQSFHKVRKTYTDWTAQIIQHEIDHLHGILI